MESRSTSGVEASVEVRRDCHIPVAEELPDTLVTPGMGVEQDFRIDVAELVKRDWKPEPPLGHPLHKERQRRGALWPILPAIKEVGRFTTEKRTLDLFTVAPDKSGCLGR